jgi:hypothetical protein
LEGTVECIVRSSLCSEPRDVARVEMWERRERDKEDWGSKGIMNTCLQYVDGHIVRCTHQKKCKILLKYIQK